MEMTIDEMVAYLARTRIPTVLVEGVGDRALLRRVEQELSKANIDIFPVGGKDRLHDIFDRRNELVQGKIVFLRDRDVYVATGVPADLMDYIWTSGYSIENDVIHKDVVERLADSHVAHVTGTLSLMATWFRHVLMRHANSKEVNISRDVTWVVSDGALSADAVADMEGELAPPFDQLALDDSWRWLRGKTLLRVVQYCLEKGEPNYNKQQIIDLSLKLGPSPAFKTLMGSIEQALNS